jgi:3-phytase
VDFRLDGPGDNVDDPCFWVDPKDASKSLVFVTAKDSGLVEVYEVASGQPRGTIPGFGIPNNCAVEGDLLLTTDRKPPQVRVHHLPDLAPARSFGQDMRIPEGIDVLTLPDGRRHVYVTDSEDASVHVYDLTTGEKVRAFPTGFGRKIEPILADDAHQRIFVAREEKGGPHGIGLFTPDGKLVREFGAQYFGHDTEGLAIYACGTGGYLVAADQDKKATEFEVFARESLDHITTFRLRDREGHVTNATDGLDLLQTPLPGFPDGMLATCDGCGSSRPDEMDLVGWSRIADAVGLDRCPGGRKSGK